MRVNQERKAGKIEARMIEARMIEAMDDRGDGSKRWIEGPAKIKD
jgi:hypothetical protein